MRSSLHLSHITNFIRYDILWKNRDRSHVLGLDWISKELIQVSELYSESVQSIFRLMQQYFGKLLSVPKLLGVSLSFVALNRKPSLNQQVGCTLSPPPTEPESVTNAASFCQRVTASSQELVPSYETSLCSQQPFESSIEVSTNAVKRQKTSKHATSKLRARRCTSQEDNQHNLAFSSHASFANTHEEHQAHDVAVAANVLRSLQYGSQGYTGAAVAGLPTPDTLDFGGALQGSGNGSIEDSEVSCKDSARSVMRSCHLSTSGIARLEPNQQRFLGHIDVLPDRQASDSTLDGPALVNQVSGVNEFESQQLQVADSLFLSDFMQEYREIM
jgi:hypothetical protein